MNRLLVAIRAGLASSHVAPAALILAMVEDGPCFISKTEVAELSNVTVFTVYRALASLKKFGIIEQDRDGNMLHTSEDVFLRTTKKFIAAAKGKALRQEENTSSNDAKSLENIKYDDCGETKKILRSQRKQSCGTLRSGAQSNAAFVAKQKTQADSTTCKTHEKPEETGTEFATRALEIIFLNSGSIHKPPYPPLSRQRLEQRVFQKSVILEKEIQDIGQKVYALINDERAALGCDVKLSLLNKDGYPEKESKLLLHKITELCEEYTTQEIVSLFKAAFELRRKASYYKQPHAWRPHTLFGGFAEPERIDKLLQAAIDNGWKKQDAKPGVFDRPFDPNNVPR